MGRPGDRDRRVDALSAVTRAAMAAEQVAEAGLLALVSATHMAMPNHWLPYSLVGRAQKWSLRRTLFFSASLQAGIARHILHVTHIVPWLTALCGACGHAASTLALTVVLSSLGSAVFSEATFRALASGLLLAIGSYYMFTYLFYDRRQAPECCDGRDDVELHNLLDAYPDRGTQSWPAAVSLVALSTFSPCVGSMPVVVPMVSPPTAGNVVRAGCVLVATAGGVMCLLVAASHVGASRLEAPWLRRHERGVLGAALAGLGVLTFFALAHSHEGHDHSHAGHSHAGHAHR